MVSASKCCYSESVRSATLESVKLLSRQAEQDVVIVLAVKEQVSTDSTFLHETELCMERDRSLIRVHAGGIAFLVPPLPKGVSEQDSNGVVGIALSPNVNNPAYPLPYTTSLCYAITASFVPASCLNSSSWPT